MLELLRTLTTLDTLGGELAEPTLRQTDKLDHLLLHGLGDGSVGALDHGLLGDAELVLLVDVRVLLDRVAVSMPRRVDGGDRGPLGLVLVAPLLLTPDLLNSLLGQRRALAGLGPVGLPEQFGGLEDAFLGGLELGPPVVVVVSAEAAVRAISPSLLLNLHSLAGVSDPG